MSASRQQALVSKVGLDGMIGVSPQNVTYTGQFKVPTYGIVPGRLAFTLVTEKKSYLIVVNMEESTAKRYAKVDEVVAYREFGETAVDKLAALISDLGLLRVGIELNEISAHDFLSLKERLGRVQWEDSTPLFQELRTTKEQWEIELLTKMAQLASTVHEEIRDIATIGMTESELGLEIMRLMIRGGADDFTLLCVGFGDRSALPNAWPTEKTLTKGDIVRIDILASMQGYHSDIARTTVAQTSTHEQSVMWNNLVEVHRRLLDLISPGRETREVYEVYEQAFTRLGLPLTDFVGHGLGLDIHESPFVSRFHNAVLEPGMVLCIEPLVFFEDCGYHIEDTLLVTDEGRKLLSSFDEFAELQSLCK